MRTIPCLSAIAVAFIATASNGTPSGHPASPARAGVQTPAGVSASHGRHETIGAQENIPVFADPITSPPAPLRPPGTPRPLLQPRPYWGGSISALARHHS